VAEGVNPRQHNQTEGQSHAHEADTQLDLVIAQELGGQNGTPATSEHQPEGAQKFRTELGDQRRFAHFSPSCRWRADRQS
jgi:hypothetical protein